jgi:hypothetical protein
MPAWIARDRSTLASRNFHWPRRIRTIKIKYPTIIKSAKFNLGHWGLNTDSTSQRTAIPFPHRKYKTNPGGGMR